MKQVIYISLIILFAASVSGAEGNWTGDNATDSFTVEPGAVSENVSVNQYGVSLANVSASYFDNSTSSTRVFSSDISGNVSGIVDFPERFTLFHNQSGTYPLIGNVGESQSFGSYTGNLSLTATDNSNFSENISLTVNVFDDVSPVFDSVNVSDVMSTESVSWSVDVSDNLDVSRVEAEVLREVESVDGNGTVTVNESVKEFDFERNNSVWKYEFNDTSEIGQYYVNITGFDTSNNTVNKVYPFQVEGLDSISVLTENFVFDTVRPQEETSIEIVDSVLSGKEVGFSLSDLSYGGNATVRVGVRPPGAESVEVLDLNESRNYSESGVYELVLIHSGADEVKGTHRVTGEVVVERPGQHVGSRKVSSSFTGTVKNLDKPAETCTRFKEFDGCIGYSFDSVQKMFEDEHGFFDQGSSDFVYMIGRIPTDDVEGSDSWSGETSLTLGEYNETLVENRELKSELDSKVNTAWRTFSLLFIPFTGLLVAFMYFIFPTLDIDRARFSERKIRKIQTGEGKNFDSLTSVFEGN